MSLNEKIRHYRIKIKNMGFVAAVGKSIDYRLDCFVMWFAKQIYAKTPLLDTIVLESHNDFDSNGGAFYDYLIKKGYNKKYKIVWMLNNPKPNDLPENVEGYYIYKPSFRKAYHLCTAKYLLSCHFIYGSVREGQKSGYLTHGSISLKKTSGNINLPDEINFVLTPSEFIAPIVADNFGIPYPDKRQIIIGFPVHDTFYNDVPGDLGKVTGNKYNKTILWMPTFRKSMDLNRDDSNGKLPLGVPILRDMESCKALNDFLERENALLIVKIHPMQDLSTIKIQGMSNIVVLDRNSIKRLDVDNFRLMKDVDALISDYSSSSYEFLHADKPIGFTIDDVKDFKLEMNFSDPENYMPGHIIHNQKEFIQFIEDVVEGKDPYAADRKRVFDLFFKFHDGNSCQRLTEYLGLKVD